MPAVQDRLVYEIPLSEIRPSSRNPRRAFHGTDELADSLAEHGPLQPVVVRRLEEGGYEQIAGHRRVLAAQLLGWQRIAAVVREAGDNEAYILTLVENLQREDLSPKEEAESLEVLVRERGWTTRQVGEAIKRSHAYVSRRLRVFDDAVLAPVVLKNELPVSTAEELLGVVNTDVRRGLAERAALENWGRPEIRAAVRQAGPQALVRSVPTRKDARAKEVVRLVGELTAVLQAAPISDLHPLARGELRALYQRLALLVAD